MWFFLLPLCVIARRYDEVIGFKLCFLDCFVPRSDAKRVIIGTKV